MLRPVILMLSLVAVLSACAPTTRDDRVLRIPGSESCAVGEFHSVSPDGRWLIFCNEHPERQAFTVSSMDLGTFQVTDHVLAEGALLKGPGPGTRIFRHLTLRPAGWGDGLFWGLGAENNAGQILVVDPRQRPMEFVARTASPARGSLRSLNDPGIAGMRSWLAERRGACGSVFGGANLRLAEDRKYVLPLADGRPGGMAYLVEKDQLVRLGSDCRREALLRIEDSLRHRRFLREAAVSADERFLAYKVVGTSKGAPLGGHVHDEVHIMELKTGRKMMIMRADQVGRLVWLKDGRTLVYSAQTGTERGLYKVDAGQLWP